MSMGRSELLVILAVLVYALFAYQLSGLLRARRYKTFLVRLILAPVVLLLDWPIRRSQWKDTD